MVIFLEVRINHIQLNPLATAFLLYNLKVEQCTSRSGLTSDLSLASFDTSGTDIFVSLSVRYLLTAAIERNFFPVLESI